MVIVIVVLILFGLGVHSKKPRKLGISLAYLVVASITK